MATGDELFERLTALAVRIIKLSQALPRDVVGQHVARQLLKSGTSAGANYEEARGAESRADFIHKLGIVLKELKEARYWLMVTSRTELTRSPGLGPVLSECEELCAIIGKSILTAKKNRPRKKGGRPGSS